MYAEIFLRRALRTPAHERVIAGTEFRGVRKVEVALLIDDQRKGCIQISRDDAAIVAQAAERVRTSSRDHEIGHFVDGRFRVDVATGSHPSGTAIYFQKVDGQEVNAGRPVALYGDEIEALEAGLAWLTS